MDTTGLSEAHAAGHREAASQLVPLVYSQLQVLAGRYMRRERPGHSLRPADLVHEACLKLIDTSRISWQGKTHFFAVAAKQMRLVLVDHARTRRSLKRGGGAMRLTLDDNIAPTAGASLEVLALDEALNRLAILRPRQSRTVVLRFFGGLTIQEAAYVMGVSTDVVKADWRMARAWLLRELHSTKEN